MYSRDNSYSSAEGVDFSSVFMRAATTDRGMANQAASMQMLDDDIVDPRINEAMYDPALTENKNLSSIITHIRDDGAARLRHKKSAPVARRKIQQRTKNAASRQNQRSQQQTRSKPEHKRNLHPAAQSYLSIQADKPAVPTNIGNKTHRQPGRWQPFLLSLAIAVTAVMGFNLYQLNDQATDMKAQLKSYEKQIDKLSSTQKKSSDTIINVSRMKKELVGLKQEVSELETGLASTRDAMTAIKAAKKDVRAPVTVKTKARPLAATARPSTAAGWVVNLASLSSKQKAQLGAAALERSGIQADVDPVMVNGTMLYRLSVKGFSSRAEAKQFVDKARLQYGFAGGWVRQG